MEAVVEARGLLKRYHDKPVVNGIDLAVRSGECFGLLGPNGAGKTTTLRMLLGMTPPNGGELRVLGHVIPSAARAMHARLGVVPQQDSLDPDFTVLENLRTFGSYFRLSGAAFEEHIRQLLGFANLESKANAAIGELSGGMKRRLSLARALVNSPQLIILDEPTTGLDPQARQLIWQRLRLLLNEGRTLILTTHYMDEAQRLCDRVAIMDDGRILDVDAPAALIRRHIEPHVVEVYGSDVDRWFEAQGRALAARAEKVGETLFCYAHEERALVESLAAYRQLQHLHRPANLEDVFLKLTGRELRE